MNVRVVPTRFNCLPQSLLRILGSVGGRVESSQRNQRLDVSRVDTERTIGLFNRGVCLPEPLKGAGAVVMQVGLVGMAVQRFFQSGRDDGEEFSIDLRRR